MGRRYYKMPQSAKARAVQCVDSFHADLMYLGSIGISVSNIAAEIGVSGRQVVDWRGRRWLPRSPVVYEYVVAWAAALREAATYQRVSAAAEAER